MAKTDRICPAFRAGIPDACIFAMLWKCLAGLLLALLLLDGRGQDLGQSVPFELEDGFIWLEVRSSGLCRSSLILVRA